MNYKDNDVLQYFRTSVSGKGFQRCIQNLAKNITGAFSKIVNGFQQLTISAESSILDVWQGSENASGIYWEKLNENICNATANKMSQN